MEKIKLQGITELKEKENLPEVPELVQKYLEIKERVTDGKYFQIKIEEKSNPSSHAGIAYSNALIIKQNGEQVYTTGMRQYRDAYSSSNDNWSAQIYDTAILEESENELVYVLRTGTGYVDVYRFSEKQPKLTVSFNTRDYKATEERIKLLENVITDPEAFRSYVSEYLGCGWGAGWKIPEHVSVWERECLIFDRDGKKPENKEIPEKSDVIVMLAKHYDKGGDAIVNQYQFVVWVRNKGIGFTGVHKTGLHHPGGKFYCVSIGIKNFSLKERNDGSLIFASEVCKTGDSNQKWEESREYKVEWE